MLIFSLPSKHNSGCQLPEELPGGLLHTPLIWVHRDGIIPSLQRFYDSPYAVLHRSPPTPSPSKSGPGTRSSLSTGSSPIRTQMPSQQSAIPQATAQHQNSGQASHHPLWQSTCAQSSLILRLPGLYSRQKKT
jgi:hypothetical protein